MIPGTVKNSMISMMVFIWSMCHVSCPVWVLSLSHWQIYPWWSTQYPLSQCPYSQGYRYDIVRDDHDLYYHTYMPRYTDTATTTIQNAMFERIQVLMAVRGGFGGPVYSGKKWVVRNFVAHGILSTTWWFLHPRPWSNLKKDFQTQNGVSPVRLCCQPSTA